MSTARTLSGSPNPTHARSFQHVVQFYEQDSFLIETLGRHFAPVLATQTPALLVVSKSHLKALEAELAARGINARDVAATGLYVALDAKETLARFMVEGWPDAERFESVVGAAFVALNAKAPEAQVAAFGEMVAILWAEGRHEAAIHLERLWNDLALKHSFTLMCAYPLAGFDWEKHAKLFFSICGEHNEVCPAEDYPARGSEGQRRRAVLRLQQKNRALENEIRLSQERVQLLQAQCEAGTWEMDFGDESLTLSSKAARLLGVPAGSVPFEQLSGLMAYSGDRDNFIAAIRRLRMGRKEFVTDFRVKRRNEVRILSIRGKTFYNGGQPLVLGVLTDITPR